MNNEVVSAKNAITITIVVESIVWALDNRALVEFLYYIIVNNDLLPLSLPPVCCIFTPSAGREWIPDVPSGFEPFDVRSKTERLPVQRITMSADVDFDSHLRIQPSPTRTALPESIESDCFTSQMRGVRTCRYMAQMTSIHAMTDDRPISLPYS